jgi:4-amino-4-deoxy-L-arabinose transferase-like glycosyltransferase
VSQSARVLICAALFAAVAFALLFRIAHVELRHRSEKRTVAVVAEMLDTDAWLVPTLGGRARLQKPPLYYWVAASAAKLAGGPSLVALRSVSLVSGLALVALVFAWGFSLGGYGCALASAVTLVAMGQFWSSSTHATVDVLLALFTTAALFAFERRSLPALSLLFALAFLTKATAAFVNVLVPAGVWLAATRELQIAKRPHVLLWIALATLLSAAWYVTVLLLVPGAPELLREFLFAPLGTGHNDLASDHYRSVFWYLPRVLGATTPAIVFLPFVVRDGVNTRFWHRAPRLRFLAMSALALFIAWSLVPQKGRHYLLPILPLFALLVGEWLARVLTSARR